jgi:hypothetical protein
VILREEDKACLREGEGDGEGDGRAEEKMMGAEEKSGDELWETATCTQARAATTVNHMRQQEIKPLTKFVRFQGRILRLWPACGDCIGRGCCRLRTPVGLESRLLH